MFTRRPDTRAHGTATETLVNPEGFQRSEFLLEHGQVDCIVSRSEMRAKLSLLLEYMGAKRRA